MREPPRAFRSQMLALRPAICCLATRFVLGARGTGPFQNETPEALKLDASFPSRLARE